MTLLHSHSLPLLVSLDGRANCPLALWLVAPSAQGQGCSAAGPAPSGQGWWNGHQLDLAVCPAWHRSGQHAMAAVLNLPRGHVVRRRCWPSRTAWVKRRYTPVSRSGTRGAGSRPRRARLAQCPAAITAHFMVGCMEEGPPPRS